MQDGVKVEKECVKVDVKVDGKSVVKKSDAPRPLYIKDLPYGMHRPYFAMFICALCIVHCASVYMCRCAMCR